MQQSFPHYSDSFRRPSQTPKPHFQHDSISPRSQISSLPFLHSLQPGSWSEDSLFSTQYQNRPASANSAISNVRGAPNELKSSPVANRETVLVSFSVTLFGQTHAFYQVNDQYSGSMNDSAIESASKHLFSDRFGSFPSNQPFLPTSRLALKRPAAALLPSVYLATSEGQPQWSSYRLNSISSPASLSPSAESAAPSDTPPLIWPDTGSSYTSEGPSSRQPSYFSLPTMHNLSPRAHDDRNRTFSMPSPGLGLMVDEAEQGQGIQQVARDRASIDGDRDSSSLAQGNILSAHASPTNLPTTSLPFEACFGGSNLYSSDNPYASSHVNQVPAILAPRPRYASSDSPPFMSANFQYPFTQQETVPLNRDMLQAFENRYKHPNAPLQWQHSSAPQDQLALAYNAGQTSAEAYSLYGQPSFWRPGHSIPLPPTHHNVHPPLHPVYQLQNRRLSQLPTRAVSISSATRQEDSNDYANQNYYPSQYGQEHASVPQMHLRAPSENVDAPQQKRVRYDVGWDRQSAEQNQTAWSFSRNQEYSFGQQRHSQGPSNNTSPDTSTSDVPLQQSLPVYTPMRQSRQVKATIYARDAASSSDAQENEPDCDESGSYEPEEEAPRRLQIKRPTLSRSQSSASASKFPSAPNPSSLPVASSSASTGQAPLTSAEDTGSSPWQTRRPPDADFNTADEALIPREQKTRFADDVYTPKWIRGKGANKEGYCSICPTGQWLRLKTSAFW